MKKTMQLSLLLAFAFTAFAAPLLAQNINNDDMQNLVSKYEAAYNNKDDKAIGALFTKDALRTNPDGTTLNGADAIAAFYADRFKESDATLHIMPGNMTTNADGTVTSTGTFSLSGKTKSGQAIDMKGGYTNTLVQQDGQWKISKSVITAQ